MVIKVTAPPAPDLGGEYRRRSWWPSAPVGEGLERVAELDGKRVALIDNEATWTYSQLRDQVERSLGALLDAGLEREQPVVIVARNTNSAAAVILGTIRASGVAVVLDRRCGPLDVTNAIESSRTRLGAAACAPITAGVAGSSRPIHAALRSNSCQPESAPGSTGG